MRLVFPFLSNGGLAALEAEDPSLQSQGEVKRQTLDELQLQRDLLEQEKEDVTTALDILFLGSICGAGSCANQISPDAVSGSRRQGHTCTHLAQDGIHID